MAVKESIKTVKTTVRATAKRCARVERKWCVACGACQKVCPKEAIAVFKGCHAEVESEKCVGCGICAGVCPAGALTVFNREVQP